MSPIGSAVFYFILALSTSGLAELSVRLKTRPQKMVAGWLSILVPAYFAGIRAGIGTDYYFTYEPYFEYLAGRAEMQLHNREQLDIGYHLLNVIVAELGGSFHVLLFIVSVLTFVFFRKAILVYKKQISVGLATLVFMFIYYQQSLNIMRQMLAATIILYAFHYIDERKSKQFVAWVLVAALFHKTAVVVLPFYILANVVTKKRTKILTFVFYCLFFYAIFHFESFAGLVDIIDPSGYYSSYLTKVSEFSFSLGLLIRTVPYAIAAFLFWDVIKKNRTILICMNSFLLGNIMRLIVYMTRFDADRIALYFLMPQVIFVPYLARSWNKRWGYFVGTAIMIGITVVLWYFDYVYMGRTETIPYTSIYENPYYSIWE